MALWWIRFNIFRFIDLWALRDFPFSLIIRALLLIHFMALWWIRFNIFRFIDLWALRDFPFSLIIRALLLIHFMALWWIRFNIFRFIDLWALRDFPFSLIIRALLLIHFMALWWIRLLLNYTLLNKIQPLGYIGPSWKFPGRALPPPGRDSPVWEGAAPDSFWPLNDIINFWHLILLLIPFDSC